MDAPRVIAYTRVSTGEQAASGLGLDAQAAAIAAEVTRRGWTLERTATDAGISGGKAADRRPALAGALDDLAAGRADVLVVAKLDRLTRSLADLSTLMGTAREQSWSLVALDMDVDTTTPTGELICHVMGAVAQWERRAIGERTASALAALKAQGQRLGRPVTLPEPVRARIAAEREAGRTLRAIAAGLTADAVPTAQGGAKWHASTVAAVLKSLDLDAQAVEDAA